MELRKVLFQKEKQKGRKAGVAFSWGCICMEYEEHCVLNTGAVGWREVYLHGSVDRI